MSSITALAVTENARNRKNLGIKDVLREFSSNDGVEVERMVFYGALNDVTSFLLILTISQLRG